MKEKFGVSLITIVLVLMCVFLSEEFISNYGQWSYFIQLFSIIIYLLKINNNYIFFFSPPILTLFYLNISFGFGHYILAQGLVWDVRFYDAFLDYESLSFITGFLLLCNLFVFLSISFNKFKNVSLLAEDNQIRSNQNVLLFFLILFLLSFIKIDLSFIGGHGDFSYVFELVTAIFIILLVRNYRKTKKYLSYLFIIIFFTVGNYDSKREILYPIILILFVEFVQNNITIKIKLKQAILFFLGFICIFYIIILASIMRGYGNFEVNDPLDASKYVPNYLQSDYAVSALANNFEVSYVYGNVSNAIDYVYKGEVDLLYGSTFTKFIFIAIPRSIFPEKPLSMIDIYTQKFAPYFRDRGGSYPIGLYAESFWNFHLLSFPFIYFFFFIINKYYLKIFFLIRNSIIKTSSVFLIFMYVTFIQFIRGSGFEIWLLYGLLSLPFSSLLIILLRKKHKFRFA